MVAIEPDSRASPSYRPMIPTSTPTYLLTQKILYYLYKMSCDNDISTTVAEWSKAFDSSSNLARGVGSNPTGSN